MPAIHRNADLRICGATTIVVGQNTVFANQRLVSVNGDPNSHGGGNLFAACRQVYAEGVLVVNDTPEGAAPDGLCPIPGGTHCAPLTAGGSPNVFVGD